MKNLFKKLDMYFIEIINKKMKNKFLDKFMYRITDLGGAIFTTVFSTVLLIFGDNRMKRIGLEALMVLGLSQLIVQIFKIGLGRERPYNALLDLNTFDIYLKDYSFPSGHTTASFSIATTLALNISGIWPVVFFLALIIGISRIYLAVHYPTDVLAGIILGTSSSLAIHFHLYHYVEAIGRIIGIF